MHTANLVTNLPPQGVHEEARRSERRSCAVKGRWRKLGDKEATTLAVTVVNVSTGGLGLHPALPLRAGEMLAVKFDAAHPRFAKPTLVRVVRTGKSMEGRLYAGCTFAAPLRQEELEVLVESGRDALRPESGWAIHLASAEVLPSTPRRERRRSPRKRVQRIHLSLRRDNSSEPSIYGWIVDQSTGGLSLSSPRTFPVGAIINVQIHDGQNEGDWLPLRVRYCEPQGNRFKLGVCFLSAPPPEVAALLS
jgi:hypothetical protein